jgi:hypothetical protein
LKAPPVTPESMIAFVGAVGSPVETETGPASLEVAVQVL